MSKPYADTMTAMLSSGPLTLSDRLAVWRQLARVRVREFLQFDSTIARLLTAVIALGGAAAYSVAGRQRRALELLTAAHRATMSRPIRSLIERILRQPPPGTGLGRRINAAYDEYLGTISIRESYRQPRNLLGTRVMVVKSPAPRERGVVLIDYTYTFPIIARYFDLPKLCERYYIVLEPSWIGLCTPEILVYSRLPHPVFVQTNEIPDIQFLRVSDNFIPITTQANWWIDHRVFCPAVGVEKDFDVSMVSAWADYKRHAAVFAALGRLRRRGQRMRTLLIGYTGDGSLTREDVFRQARYFGVADQIEIQENLAIEEVGRQLSRSKVHVVWSRREGSNRSIIEAMLTGVPAILREGFNYGQHYPYINPRTGRFANEETLPDALVEMTTHYHEYDPRAWVMTHMTPQAGRMRIDDAIRQVALGRGESWSSEMVVRTAQLRRAPYWNPDDAARFASDYQYLGSLVIDG